MTFPKKFDTLNKERWCIMDSYSIIVLIFGLLIIIALIVVFFLNRLIGYQNKVKDLFATILEYLDARMKLIDEMIKFISSELNYEENFIKKLEQTKVSIQNLFQNSNSLKEFKKYEKEFLSFLTLEKVYPSLKKNKKYLALKQEIELNQERVVYAMDSYDKGVMNYNDYQKKKLIRFLARVFHFPKYDYYNK